MKQDFFINNRRRLRQLTGAETIVISANGLSQRNSSNSFPFRQDSNFYYLTGIDEPGLVLVMNKSSEYLIAPKRNTDQINFDGVLDPKEFAKHSGITEVFTENAGWERLKNELEQGEVATLFPAPSYVRFYGLFTNPARTRLVRKLKRFMPNLDIIDIRETLAKMRVIKQPAEITAIQTAIDITASGIETVINNPNSYKYEYEIEAELTKQFRSRGASGHSFSPIVAGGKNACTLHNVANNSKLSSNELVVLDVGAEVSNYAADLTRTLALGGNPTNRQRQVYGAVLEVQDFAFGLLRPGVYMRDYEKQVADFMGQKLARLGLIDKTTNADVRKYYPHATSHFMGLDVHDIGDYYQPLAENMVLTCEPGIYIPEENIGVRIEDDVLITREGNRILSRDLTRGLC